MYAAAHNLCAMAANGSLAAYTHCGRGGGGGGGGDGEEIALHYTNEKERKKIVNNWLNAKC